MSKEETVEKIKDLLERMRPFLINDGGDLEYVDYKDHIVYIRLSGACKNCSLIDVTLQDGIQEMLTTEIPEVEGVVNVD
jgi:Fe-S cluster biogenesis protein NfuA